MNSLPRNIYWPSTFEPAATPAMETATSKCKLALVQVGSGETYSFAQSELYVGRSKENGIVIEGDLTVSRFHAAMRVKNGLVYLQDLGSANGTLLNGKVVDELMLLSPDDIIYFGRTRFVFSPTKHISYYDSLPRQLTPSLPCDQGKSYFGKLIGSITKMMRRH